jgi:endogenous inhibitor of DNA gyrase (YacG/DUF329 family)
MPTPPACPICGAPAAADAAPFCSAGCKDRDLLRWLDEGYRLPGLAADADAQTGLDSAAQPD